MQAIMLDLETMDTKPTAAILSIGACSFDPEHTNEADELPTFERRITLVSNEALGRTFSASTIQWWLQQPKAAQQSLYEGDLISLKQALFDLRAWINALSPTPHRLWAKDPDFDNNILADAFGALGEPPLFKYWQTRSVRTVVELGYPDGDAPAMAGTKHSAVEDAVWQALLVQSAVGRLR